MPNICAITTCRSDYGYWKPVLEKLSVNKNFKLSIIAPKNHPNVEDIKKLGQHEPTSQIIGINDAGAFYSDCLTIFSKNKYDAVGLLGDRFEISMAAIAATVSNITIFHLHGGETTTGAFDNELRNAITMMSKWHFTANFEFSEKVVEMIGQNKKGNVFTVGTTSLEDIQNTKLKSIDELQNYFCVNLNKPFSIVIFNPVTRELLHARWQIGCLLQALYDWGGQVILIMPNIDPGNGIIRESIHKMAAASLNTWQVCEYLPRDIFLSLMQHAHMMIGNSSSGIIEAPYFKLPVLNIGIRQRGRPKASNILNCGVSRDKIFEGICKLAKLSSLIKSLDIKNPYNYDNGIGLASDMIISILEEVIC